MRDGQGDFYPLLPLARRVRAMMSAPLPLHPNRNAVFLACECVSVFSPRFSCFSFRGGAYFLCFSLGPLIFIPRLLLGGGGGEHLLGGAQRVGGGWWAQGGGGRGGGCFGGDSGDDAATLARAAQWQRDNPDLAERQAEFYFHSLCLGLWDDPGGAVAKEELLALGLSPDHRHQCGNHLRPRLHVAPRVPVL